MEWAPIIYHLNDDLTKFELWKIKLGGNWSDSLEFHATIDHLKVHYGSQDYLFGTTRTHLRETSNTDSTQIWLFRVRLNSLHELCAQTGCTPGWGSDIFTKIDAGTHGVTHGSLRVTGISNSLESSNGEDKVMHIIFFDSQKYELWYA